MIKTTEWTPKVIDQTEYDIKGNPIGQPRVRYAGIAEFSADTEEELIALQEMLRKSSYLTTSALTMKAQSSLLEAIKPERGL